MIIKNSLATKRLVLKNLTINHANEIYEGWLRDPLVNRYLEVRHSIPDIASLEQYIRIMNISSKNLLLGIFIDAGKHIGNIKLGPIDWRNNRAGVGLLIGDRNSWNKGYATEVIKGVTQYAIEKLNLNRVEASCYHGNVASFNAFMKAGYKEEGRMKNYWQTDNGYEDNILMAYLKAKASQHEI